MFLEKPISWYNSLILTVPLTIVIFQILNYYLFNAFGITAILVLCCFTPFFFLRRNYEFKLNILLYLYFICIVGSFFIAYFKVEWIFILIILFSWISVSQNIKLSNNGIEIQKRINKEELEFEGLTKNFATPTKIAESKKYLIDFFIVITTVFITLFLISFITNILV